MPRRLTLTETERLIEPETLQAARNKITHNYPDAIGILVHECADLSSPNVGVRFVLAFGPRNTVADLPADSRCRVQPPIGYAWQYQIVGWLPTADLFETAEV